MFRSLFRSRATWLAVLLSLIALFMLRESLFDAWNASRLSAARVCFRHVGASEKLLPRICVSSEARAPDGPDVIDVFVSGSDLQKFIDLVAEEPSAEASEATAFGTYELESSLQPRSTTRILAKTEMQAIIGDLMDLLDAEHDPRRKAALDALRSELAVSLAIPNASSARRGADDTGGAAATAVAGRP